MGTGPSSHTTSSATDTLKNALSSFTGGGATTGFQNATTQVQIPKFIRDLMGQSAETSEQALNAFQQGIPGISAQIQPAVGQLQDTIAGKYLFGGEGQQAFIDAAVRAAQPGVYSAFGAAGRGGSGLERAQLDQTAVDSFARLFGDERNRMQQASLGLPGVATVPADLQSRLAQLAGGIPGQFSPFLGSSVSGTSGGTSQQFGQTVSNETGKMTGSEKQPIYQPPWWQTALGLGAGVAGMAVPGLGGVSALGNVMNLFGPGTVK